MTQPNSRPGPLTSIEGPLKLLRVRRELADLLRDEAIRRKSTLSAVTDEVIALGLQRFAKRSLKGGPR